MPNCYRVCFTLYAIKSSVNLLVQKLAHKSMVKLTQGLQYSHKIAPLQPVRNVNYERPLSPVCTSECLVKNLRCLAYI